MPNGRPGDHPLTDIVEYGSSEYPSDIETKVRALAVAPGFDAHRERVADVLWDNWPKWGNVTPDYEVVRSTLAEVERAMESATQ